MVTIKNKLKYTVAFVFAIIFFVANFIPFANFAKADGESEPEIYELITLTDQNYNTAASIYSIPDIEKEQVTPFNSVTEKYYEGWSIFPQTDSNNEFNTTYNVLDRGSTYNMTRKSFYVWVYFSNTFPQEYLEFVLNNINSSRNIKIKITASELEKVLTKVDVDYEEGYSWNLIEFPLSTVGEYEAFTSITIKYYSTGEVEAKTTAELNFYNMYISDSQNTQVTAISKQRYNGGKIKYPTDAVLDNLFTGDKITFPSRSAFLLEYAYWGKYDLLKTYSDLTIVWRIGIAKGNEKINYYSLGNEFTFDKEGLYKISYNCTVNRGGEHSKTAAEIVFEKYIENFYGMYFENPSFVDLKVGNSYIISFTMNPALTQTQDLTVQCNKEYIDVEEITSSYVKIKIKQKGNTTLKIVTKGRRTGRTEETEYVASTNIIAKEKSNTRNYDTFKTICYITLALVGVVLLVFLIKTLVKAHKYNVK